jgi:hypothetical protein
VLKPQAVPRSNPDNPSRAPILRAALAVACFAALAGALWPGSAVAARTVTVLGQTQSTPSAACPQSPCEAVGSVTGFQTVAGSVAKPFVVPFNGRMVAWSISMSKPKSSQQSFFNNFYGSPPEARIAVLSQVTGVNGPPRYKLLRQGPTVVLTPFLGSDVTFALDQPLIVKTGNIIGLTIPTWAPAFAVGLTDNSGWRASRGAGKCTQTTDIKASHPQQKVGSEKQYGCFYKTARLLYTATVVKG